LSVSGSLHLDEFVDGYEAGFLLLVLNGSQFTHIEVGQPDLI
jgi:hypothetical protein